MGLPSVIGTTRAAWSIREVAKRSGLSEQFVRMEIKGGRLRAKQLQRRILIPAAAETAWLESAPDAGARR
jgi:excisionase family DNA binding protein